MKRIALLLSFVAALTSCENPAVLSGLATVGINYGAKRNVFNDDDIEALRAVQGILLPVTSAKNPKTNLQP